MMYYVFAMFASNRNGFLEDKKIVVREFVNFEEAKGAYRLYTKKVKKWKRMDIFNVAKCTFIQTPDKPTESEDWQKSFLAQQPKLLAETR